MLDPPRSNIRPASDDSWLAWCMADVETPGRAETWTVFGVGAVLGCLVRWVYWQADFCWDDRYAFLFIGLVQTDRMPLWQFVAEPWNAHWMPLWKFIYYLLWQVFGLHYEVYHFIGDMWHAASVPALYGLTLFYFHRRLPALIAAILWSVACMGQWDDTLLLVYSQCNAGAMALFLWALYAQTKVFRVPGWRWPVTVAIVLNLGFAMWGVSWLWSPVFVLQHFLLRLQTPADARPRKWATALCLVPVAVWGVLSICVFLLTRETGGNDPLVPLEVLARVGGQFVTTLGNMVGPPLIEATTFHLWWEVPLAAIVLAMAFAHREARVVLSLLLLMTLIHLLLANLWRTGYEYERSLIQARYLYPANLFWCAALGAALALWKGEFVRRRALAVAAVAALMLLAVVHQTFVARAAYDANSLGWKWTTAVFRENRALLKALGNSAKERHEKMLVADIPLWIPRVHDMYFPMSAFHAICADEEAANLTIVPAAWLTPQQVRATAERMSQERGGLVQSWANLTVLVYDDVQMLKWLDRFIADAGLPSQMPDLWRTYDQIHVHFSELVQFGSDEPLAHLEFIPFESWTEEQRRVLLAKLRESTAPEAKYWFVTLNKIETQTAPRALP